MGKKKSKGEYNDFLDGEKLRDNTEIRTTLQGFAARDIPPPPAQQGQNGSKKQGKGGAKKPQFTHFLCLPLVTDTSRPQLQQKLEDFKEELAKDGPVPTKAVRPVGTLHLTLGVMSLDDQTLEEAKQYLQDLDLYILLRDITHRRVAEEAAESGEIAENLNAAAMPDTDALTINLEALIPMQAPHKTSILYAEPQDASQRLQPFAAALREQFAEKGFLVEDPRPLRLHATIMNTIYTKPKGGRGRSKSSELKDGFKHIEHQVSPHHHANGEDTHINNHNNPDEDGASKTGSLDGNDTTTAPPDPSTAESPRPNGEGHGPDGKSWMRFDARNLINKYKGFVWAEGLRVDRVCICKMGAKKIWSGGREGEGEGEVLDEQYEVVCEKEIFW